MFLESKLGCSNGWIPKKINPRCATRYNVRKISIFQFESVLLHRAVAWLFGPRTFAQEFGSLKLVGSFLSIGKLMIVS